MPLQEEMEQQGNWLFKYRGILPFTFFAAGAFVYLQSKSNPLPKSLVDTGFETYFIFFCFLISFLGLIMRVLIVGFASPNTSGRNTEEQVADSVNKTGAYSMVRHPLYVGNFFMWLGVALLTRNLWFIVSFIFLYWLYYERIMFAEEQYLRKKYGDEYINWASKTPPFIPAFRQYIKPNLPFSWKKVLKQEKTGLFLLFLVFFLLNAAGNYQEKKVFIDGNSWLSVGCGASFILYAILKFLKSKTHVLDEEGR